MSISYLFIKKLVRINAYIRGLKWSLYIKMMGGKCGSNLYIEKGFYMKYPPHSGIIFGNNISFGRNITLEVPIGSILNINKNTSFTGYSYVSVALKVFIGEDVLIGEFTSIRDAFHGLMTGKLIREQPMIPKEIIINNNIWIGRGVTIFRGVTIGNGSVIGANSLVNKHIPENVIAFGTPAKIQTNR
jgi:acetyltransferase-like isoleucine patch superfamily enzyme